MRRSHLAGFVSVCLCLSLSPPAPAEVRLPAVFSDHMVLQRGMAVHVWGTAAPGEDVEVSIATRASRVTAGDDGQWSAVLEPMDAGGPHVLAVTGTNRLTFEDVMVGEVWVCSGQSNMQWSVARSKDAAKEIAGAKHPLLRLFTVKRAVSAEPLDDVAGSWVRCGPETVGGFSAVAYFFGRKLHEELGVPVGLIHTSWGGTPVEAWTSRGTLDANEDARPILERWQKMLSDYPAARQRHEARIEEWKKEVERAKAAGERPPRRPRGPLGPDHPHRPAGLYNAMVAPLIPYAVRGAIWYQGESNAGRAYQYRSLFPQMIRDWRSNWKQPELAFHFVQLANYMKVEDEPGESAWAELREAQLMALSLPGTGMAVTIDIGEAEDIHPRNKQDVGLRLALSALGTTYNREVVACGPLPAGMEREGGKIRLSFKHVGAGLEPRGGDAPVGFAIAGNDRRFVWAEARIDGDEVVVWSDTVPEPVAVRYAWANNPRCNLYNKAGLPASPFRTDTWDGVTVGKR